MAQVVITIGYYRADGSKDMAVISPSPTLTNDGLVTAISRVIKSEHSKPLWVESSSEHFVTHVTKHYGIPKRRPADWDPIANYKLDVELGTLTLTDIVNVDLKKLHSVLDTTLGKHIKWESASGNVITLDKLPDGAQDSDSLMIDYRSAI